MHDRVNLPERHAISPDVLRVHLVQHDEPSAHVNAGLCRHQSCQAFLVPVGMRYPHARRDLDDDARTFIVMLVLGEPEMKILVTSRGRIAVRRLGDLALVATEIALDLDGYSFEAFDLLRLTLRPLVAEPIADTTRPG